WKQVAQAQAQTQTTSTEQSDANVNTDTPKLSNLSTDGKAWFIHPVAMVDYFNIRSTEIIFPLKVKPINNFDMQFGKRFNWTKNDNQTMFGSNRSGGKRKHAGRDLYTEPNTEIVAICDGVVLQISGFYSETDQITIKHKTSNGRQFIIRYGEVDHKSINVKVGDVVKQGTVLAKTGLLLKELKVGEKSGHTIEIKINSKQTKKYRPLLTIDGHVIYMLHLEYYSGENGLDLKNPLTNRANLPYQRRADLLDPLELLKEGYRNSFSSEPQ
ncbi:M23 family metallopeptidase, partial [Gilliamella bombi]|uniref:M23 family metallopeptidase n=1 Tax=Gilliamella bombi TaxID=1908521 RepID=UPI001ABFC1AE